MSRHYSLIRETPVPIDVDKHEMHEVRTPDFAFRTYHDDEIDLQLKIGKWETNGVKEVWHANLKKGLTFEFNYPHPHYEIYSVLSGKLKVTILDKEYIVEKDTLIHIPPSHKHTIEVSEDTSLFDYGGEMDLMALLEDLESVKKYKPEILDDPIQKTKFLYKYSCYITNVTRR